MAIRQNIPFDSKNAAEEFKESLHKLKETFQVLTCTGKVAETITRRVTVADTEITFKGMQFPIRGTGFNRFIQF